MYTLCDIVIHRGYFRAVRAGERHTGINYTDSVVQDYIYVEGISSLTRNKTSKPPDISTTSVNGNITNATNPISSHRAIYSGILNQLFLFISASEAKPFIFLCKHIVSTICMYFL